MPNDRDRIQQRFFRVQCQRVGNKCSMMMMFNELEADDILEQIE
jgi:hypothetical protein